MALKSDRNARFKLTSRFFMNEVATRGGVATQSQLAG